VAQKTQPKAQPAWEDTQSVRRFPDGIRTDSMASPSSSRQRYFLVPSADSWRVSTASRLSGSSVAKSARSVFGNSVAAVQLAIGAVQRRRCIWPARYPGSPRWATQSRIRCVATEGGTSSKVAESLSPVMGSEDNSRARAAPQVTGPSQCDSGLIC